MTHLLHKLCVCMCVCVCVREEERFSLYPLYPHCFTTMCPVYIIAVGNDCYPLNMWHTCCTASYGEMFCVVAGAGTAAPVPQQGSDPVHTVGAVLQV